MIGVSLFAGIGGFDLAMHRSGIYVSTAVEIDYSCQQVLARHFPATDILTNIQEVTGDQLGQGLEADIITAGWPCQGNSVAGHRGGMADPRSGLWGEVARLLGETRPQWFLGENVPGLLTVRGGRDFGIILRSLVELGYGVAWRVMDAQYTGVPQRRRRVLLVGCLGDPASAAEVLFEPESRDGDSAAGAQSRARVAGTIASSAGSGGYGGIGQSASSITSRIVETRGSHAVAEVVSTLQGGGKRGYRVDAEGAAGGHLVTAPIVFDPYNQSASATAPTLDTQGARGNGPCVCIKSTSAHGKAGTDAADEHWTESDTHPTLSHHDISKSRMKAVVIEPADAVCVTGDITHTLTTRSAVEEDGTGRGTPIITNAITSHHHRYDREETWIPEGYGVRRLTPRECERLQGFPDDWTAGQSDSARYRQLGNAVAVPVAEWIVGRIAQQIGSQPARYSESPSNRKAA